LVRHGWSSIWLHPNWRSSMPHSFNVSSFIFYWGYWNFAVVVMRMMI
jgi:hypothetical protein